VIGRLALSLALALGICADAAGEAVAIGDVSVTYAVPAEFTRADGLFSLNLKDLDKEFSMNTVVFAVLIPETDLKVRQNDRRAVPSWYVHLAYDDIFSNISIEHVGFNIITWLVKKVIEKQYENASFIEKLEAVISGALNRKLKIHAMTQEGFVDGEPRTRSILAYGRGELEGDPGPEEIELATMTTFFMDQGKLITIIQACRIGSEKDLPVFKEKALRIAAEISGR